MADTDSSLAALLALFANNSAGNISANDLRDFVVSMEPSHGSLSMVTPAASDVTVIGTYVKVAGTTALGPSPNRMSADGGNNRLKYTGAPDRHFAISASASVSGSPNNTLGLKIAKNSVVIDASLGRRAVGTGGDIGAMAIFADVVLSTDDYVELWITNEDSNSADPTVVAMYLFATAMFQ